jgi:hypothetical protein
MSATQSPAGLALTIVIVPLRVVVTDGICGDGAVGLRYESESQAKARAAMTTRQRSRRTRTKVVGG